MSSEIHFDLITIANSLHHALGRPLDQPPSDALIPTLIRNLPTLTADAAYDFTAAMEATNVQLLRTHSTPLLDVSTRATLDNYLPFQTQSGSVQLEITGPFSAGDWTIELYYNEESAPSFSQILSLSTPLPGRLVTRTLPINAGDTITITVQNTAATSAYFTIRWFDLTPNESVCLAPDGLDAVATQLTDAPTTFREQLSWLFHRFASKITLARTGQTETATTASLTVHNEEDTEITTQTLCDDALEQTISSAASPEV